VLLAGVQLERARQAFGPERGVHRDRLVRRHYLVLVALP
jgi:hypothetical protein